MGRANQRKTFAGKSVTHSVQRLARVRSVTTLAMMMMMMTTTTTTTVVMIRGPSLLKEIESVAQTGRRIVIQKSSIPSAPRHADTVIVKILEETSNSMVKL